MPASFPTDLLLAVIAGLSESLPHVYEDGEKGGLYFSFLHLLGRNKRRYKVATRNKSGPNNNIYRQSR